MKNVYDEELSAVVIAFGFAFIQPFEDGNGRLHRNIIHHVLAKRKFSQQGIIFPISASILDQINGKLSNRAKSKEFSLLSDQ